MDRIEMVEKLQEKANVSLEEAKAVLENCNWDLLDAMVCLEKEGKVKSAAAHGSSAREEPTSTQESHTESNKAKARSGESGWKRFAAFLKKLIRKGVENRFVVKRNGSVMLDVPVLIVAILMIAFFWLAIVLLIVGLFVHCEYSFTGADLGKDSINDGIRKATDAAQNLAEQVTGNQSDQ